MPYNPHIHNRKSIRLKGYDYTQLGYYYVTICVQNRECLLGSVKDSLVELNKFGKIVDQKWNNIPKHFSNTTLDEYIIMPNHIHGIIGIFEGAKHFSKTNNFHLSSEVKVENQICVKNRYKNVSPLPHPNGTKPGSLSSIIQNFSSITTRKINQIRETNGMKLWQRNYFDRIIRNGDELIRIRKYIRENPLRWEIDEENPEKNNNYWNTIFSIL